MYCRDFKFPLPNSETELQGTAHYMRDTIPSSIDHPEPESHIGFRFGQSLFPCVKLY